MRILSCDWATKKALAVYDSHTKKVKIIQNSIPEFKKFLEKLGSRKVILLFEFGGGDTFKIMAFRSGHTILQVPGKKIKDFRDKLGKEKTDEGDAELIYKFFVEAGAKKNMTKSSIKALPRLDKKREGAGVTVFKNTSIKLPFPDKNKGGGAGRDVNKISIIHLPPSFSLFTEQYADIAELKILFREHEDLKKEMVREKLRKIAFKLKFEIARVSDDRIKKMLFHKDAAIVAKEREVEQLKKILEKKVKTFNVWPAYLENLKGVGPMIAAGLIGELGGRQFDSSESLKHYAGMIPRKSSTSYNRYIKAVLFQFAAAIVKNRTPLWREMYDSMRDFYRDKHKDWRPGKLHAYAMKFVEAKFLLEFWREWQKNACLSGKA